jgi:hypothetical protein
MGSNIFVILQTVSIILHTSCAIYAFTSEFAFTAPIPAKLARVNYQPTNESLYFTTISETVIYIPSVIVIHGIVAIVTVLFHFIYIPIHYKFSKLVWDQSFLTIRWIEYSITCTLLSISSTMTNGTTDFNVLISIIFYGLALQLIGCIIEQNKRNYRPLLFLGSLIGLANAYSSIWYITTADEIYSNKLIEFLAYTFFYNLFPLNCLLDAIYRKNCFKRTDWFYIILSLSSKFSLFWLQVVDVERKIEDNITNTLKIYILGIILPSIILLLGVYYAPSCKQSKEITKESSTDTFYIVKKIAQFRILPEEKKPVVIKCNKRRLRF